VDPKTRTRVMTAAFVLLLTVVLAAALTR